MIIIVLLAFGNVRLLKNFASNNNINTLIIGDSHSQCSINDSLIPNSVNISQSGEAYFYTYAKLERILNTNPNIKTVIVGYSYHNISEYYTAFVYGNISYSFFADYFFILPVNQINELIHKNNLLIKNAYRNILNSGFNNLFAKKNNYTFLGYYDSRKEAKFDTAKMNERLRTQYYVNNKLTGFSDINIEYFEKIIDLCNNHKIRVILINTPLHKEYLDKVPLKFKEKYYSLITKRSVTLVEFNDLELDKNDYLPDGDHISYHGANLTTLYLLKNINSN